MDRVMVAVGFVVHVLLAPFFFASGLLVPGPVALVLVAVWVALLVAAIMRRNRPRFVLSVPGIAALVWLAVVQGGSWLFGWTA
jgi:hypothetical protein